MPVSLYSPFMIRRLYSLLWPPGGIFTPVSSRAEHVQKRKAAVKAIYSPVTAFYALVAIPIFPRPKTPHRGHQRPAQGINQPRPTPPGASRGIIIYCGRWIAPHSAPPFGHTRHSIYHGISPRPLRRSALYRGQVASTVQTASMGIVAGAQNLLP